MIKCPVCGKYEFEEDNDFDICPVCGWENDGVQLDDPDFEGGANVMSLNQMKAFYKEGLNYMAAKKVFEKDSQEAES